MRSPSPQGQGMMEKRPQRQRGQPGSPGASASQAEGGQCAGPLCPQLVFLGGHSAGHSESGPLPTFRTKEQSTWMSWEPGKRETVWH